MLDCISGGRIISGFVRGTAVETLHAGYPPTENRPRFEEAHDLIVKCWTDPGPFRWEGEYWPHRMVNPWVVPIQKPHPPVWFPGTGSPESGDLGSEAPLSVHEPGFAAGPDQAAQGHLPRDRRRGRLRGWARALRVSDPLPGGRHR